MAGFCICVSIPDTDNNKQLLRKVVLKDVINTLLYIYKAALKTSCNVPFLKLGLNKARHALLKYLGVIR